MPYFKNKIDANKWIPLSFQVAKFSRWKSVDRDQSVDLDLHSFQKRI